MSRNTNRTVYVPHAGDRHAQRFAIGELDVSLLTRSMRLLEEDLELSETRVAC